MKFVSVLELLVVLVCCTDVVLSDSKCLDKYGKCQYTSSGCSGSYQSNLCNGPANRKCCVPAFNDGRCISRRGTCQRTSLGCGGGSYVSGLCGGPADRRCCVSGTGTSTGGSVPSSGSGSCSGVTIVSRAQWGARNPKSIKGMPTPVSLVFIHHTAGNPCSDFASCKKVMQGVQYYHMYDPERNYVDIGYNFLVGGDGKIYEGRGWDREGGHTGKLYNNRAVAISFLGNFTNQSPTSSALRAAQNLIACGVRQGKVSSNYKLYGHRQARAASTTCPGNTLYSIIQGWNRYTSGTAP
ncbi:hypothetical protein V1264_015039 [Littorina saxatilis]|uniref:Peptidoglycan-recognition protein SC2-like n=2 Tax=Littorina saxatilis TaxID=31220 RepID=A0AAN9GGJ4_9CAEN